MHADDNARQVDGTAYDATALRTLQDWIIRPQLRSVRGVTEVNTIGGYEKQYHVTPDPARLLAFGVGMQDVVKALERSNATVGAGYLERNGEQYLVRAPGQLASLEDIEGVVVAERAGVPVTVRNLAEVALGKQLRTGAATRDGEFSTTTSRPRAAADPRQQTTFICAARAITSTRPTSSTARRPTSRRCSNASRSCNS